MPNARRPFAQLDRRELRIVVSSALVLVVFIHIAVATRLGVGLDAPRRSYGDLADFWRLGTSRGRPYVDYEASYPLLTVAIFNGVAHLASGQDSFGRALIGLNLASDLAIAWVLWRVWGRSAGIFYLVVALPMLGLIHTRADAISTVLATGGVALWVRERPVGGGALVGLAAMTKLWAAPLMLLGLGGGWDRRSSRRFTAAAVAVAGLAGFAWLVTGGADGIRQVLSHRGAAGWEIETVPGLLLLARRAPEVVFTGGAWRIGHIGAAGPLLAVLSLLVAAAAVLLGSRVRRIGVAWVTAVTSLLVLSTVLSPQFLIWLLPGAAIAWTEGHRRIALLIASAALLTGVEMERLEWLVAGRPVWIALVLLRNLLLCAALAAGLFVLLRSPRPAVTEVDDRVGGAAMMSGDGGAVACTDPGRR